MARNRGNKAPQVAPICAYCGQAGRSREHYFPEWMHPYFGHLPRGIRPAQGGGFHTKVGGGTTPIPVRTWKSNRRRIDDVATRVCVPCNGGWMSRLTNDARAVLEPLLFGSMASLDADQQDLIAQWAIMTAMTIDTRQDMQGVMDWERRDFRGDPDQRRRPMRPEWQVHLSKYDGQDWNARYVAPSMISAGFGHTMPQMFGVLFALGQGAFLVTSRLYTRPQNQGRLEYMGFQSIRPAAQQVVEFGAWHPIADAQMEAVNLYLLEEAEHLRGQMAATIPFVRS